MKQIDWLKTPFGKPSSLNEIEWKFVHSKEFVEKYGDWENKIKKDFLLSNNIVATLSGDEFSKKEGKSLTDQVEEFFNFINEHDGGSHSPFFGEVVLDRKGADDSLAHGMGRLKAVAYAAVKDVIEKGVIIDSDYNHNERGYNSFILAAPIKIKNENYICEVVVKQNKNESRFYLHEVSEQKKFLERAFVTNLAQKPAHSGTLYNILENIVSVNYEISCPLNNQNEPEKDFVQRQMNQNINTFQEENKMTKIISDKDKQSWYDIYNGERANKPMSDVKEVEFFFDKEFSVQDLTNAINEMDFYTDEIKQKYNLDDTQSPEKTFALGNLAAYAIMGNYEDRFNGNIPDETMDEIYKIGIKVAQRKYDSYKELEPKLEKFFESQEIRPYSKDMRNLEKMLDTWESRQIELRNGTGVTGEYDSVWIDNWRMMKGGYDMEWQISYKGTPVIECVDGEANYTASDYVLADAKLNIGDVLQIIEKKMDATCPQLTPEYDGAEPEYKPSHDYHIDRMKYKAQDFAKNPPYPYYLAQKGKASISTQRCIAENKNLEGYKFVDILPHSRHPEDKDLFCVMAKNEKTGKYAVWTSYNLSQGENGSLNNGHYDIKDLNTAAKIMCDFSDSTPLHAEHRQQQHRRENEVER